MDFVREWIGKSGYTAALGVERHAPGLASQSWTQPAGAKEAFGFLIFD